MSDNREVWRKQLHDSAATLGVDLSEAQLAQFEIFCAQLIKWNKAYNLTAITAPEKILTHHFLDSLSISSYLPEGHHIDVGCGAGFPCLPLAIAFPEKRFTALDSNGKKLRFIKHLSSMLGLDNIDIAHCRVENFQPEKSIYHSVLTRAFTDLPNMIRVCQPLIDSDTVLLAMKAGCHEDELDGLPEHVTIVSVQPLVVPGLEARRHLVILRGSAPGGKNIGSDQSEGRGR